MFVYFFLAFLLSLGAVPLFFLGGSPSIGRPPPSPSAAASEAGPKGGTSASGQWELAFSRAHAAFFSAQYIDFGPSQNAKKMHAEHELSDSDRIEL